MFRDMRSGAGYSGKEPFGVEEYASDTDEAVRRLQAGDRQLCVERYQVGGTAAEIAARMGMSKATMHRRVDVLHLQLIGHMNDVAAERKEGGANLDVSHRVRSG